MKQGFCSLIVNGEDSGNVEYKFNDSGSGYLWGDPEIFILSIHENDICLRIGGKDKPIVIKSATPGEPAPFAFKEWQKGA